MTGLLEDTPDLLRQLQRLNKELGPVKTALTALAKRENANPNPQAAAASLDKVAARVTDVRSRYAPLIARMGRLVETDIPATLAQTAFLATPRSHLAADVEAFRKQEVARVGVQQQGCDDDSNDEEEESGNALGSPAPTLRRQRLRKDGKTSPPASVFTNVCPPDSPFVVQPEYYQHYHDQLQLRVEMVEYLIATGRLDTARHVAEGYGLPLAWFPSLAAEALLASGPAVAVLGPGSPTLRSTSLANASPPSCSGSPLITPAMGPRPLGNGNGSGGPADLLSSPVQLPAPVSTATASGGTPQVSPILSHANPAGGAFSLASTDRSPPRVGTQVFLDEMTARHPAAHPAALAMPASQGRPQPHPTGGSPFSPTAPASSTPSPALPANGSGRPLSNAAAATPQATASATQKGKELPDLVVRVIAAALFLKDEYIDRMVLERLVMNDGFAPAWGEEDPKDSSDGRRYNSRDGTQQTPVVRTGSGAMWRPPHFLPPASIPIHQRHQQQQQQRRVSSAAADDVSLSDRSSSVLQKDLFEAAVVDTARRVSRSHLCTQSGSPQFDDAMMNVVEEMLTSALDQHTARKASPRGGSTSGAVEPPKPLRGGKSNRRLSPDELLAAEDIFSSEVLFIKRPTRYYCVHTNRVMDGSGEGGTYPRVLPNGMVVADSAVANELADIRVTCTGRRGGMPLEEGVVCPPSDVFFPLSSLKRIFVT